MSILRESEIIQQSQSGFIRFPKVRSADLFWSARVCNLVRDFSKIQCFKPINNKNCQEFQTKIQFYGPQNYFKRFCGPPKIFPFFYGPRTSKVWETLGLGHFPKESNKNK